MRMHKMLLSAAMVITLTSAVMAGTGTASAATVRAGAPSQDFIVRMVNPNSNKCVDVYHSGTTNYSNVDLYQCNQSSAQKWLFQDVGTAFGNTIYKIESVNNTSECLDAYHSGTANYTNVDIFQCNGSLAQQWISVPISGNNFSLYNLNTVDGAGGWLDVYHSGTANYTNIDIFQCNNSGAELFYYG